MQDSPGMRQRSTFGQQVMTVGKTRGNLSTEPIISGAESFLPGTAGCRIEVHSVNELFEEYKQQGILYNSGTKVESKPWGTNEFPTLDLHRNLLTFFERTNQRRSD